MGRGWRLRDAGVWGVNGGGQCESSYSLDAHSRFTGVRRTSFLPFFLVIINCEFDPAFVTLFSFFVQDVVALQ
jgi:hypothetical protein